MWRIFLSGFLVANVGAMGIRGNGSTPCVPDPCGANTECTFSPLGIAVCRCKTGFFPKPDTITGCGPQCTEDSECHSSQHCAGSRCVSPCREGICGENALCEVRSHRAICKCPPGYTGDPFQLCSIPGSSASGKVPSFGPSSSDSTSTSAPNNSGSSGGGSSSSSAGINPRPQCFDSRECSSKEVCSNSRCVDPCSMFCAAGAECQVRDHVTVCRCPLGFKGDPFVACNPLDPVTTVVSSQAPRQPASLCSLNLCGENAECKVGTDRTGNDRPVCFCPVGFLGDPLVSCRRGQCTDHTECAGDKACYGYQCVDPCSASDAGGSVCGIDARCHGRNHIAVCSCPAGFDGDPLTQCRAIATRG